MLFEKLNSEDRQKRFEQLAIEVQELRSPDGKQICIPQAMEMTRLYMQAEQDLIKESDFSIELDADEALDLRQELQSVGDDLARRYASMPEGLAKLYMELSRRVLDLTRISAANALPG